MAARFLAFFLGAALVSACAGTATGPSTAGPLRVTIQANPTFAPSPGMATFSARAENVSTGTTALTFPSSCQLLPYFFDARTGQQVTPSGGGLACLTVVTHVSLGPGESLPQSFLVRAADGPVPGSIVLPPGDYQVRVRLEDSTYRLSSEPLAFSLR